MLRYIFSGRQTCGRSWVHTGGRSHHRSSAVLALIFFARRIQLSISLVDCEVEFLCTHELIVKISVLVTAPRFELTAQRQKVSRLPTEPPGRPAVYPFFRQDLNHIIRGKFCTEDYIIQLFASLSFYFCRKVDKISSGRNQYNIQYNIGILCRMKRAVLGKGT